MEQRGMVEGREVDVRVTVGGGRRHRGTAFQRTSDGFDETDVGVSILSRPSSTVEGLKTDIDY